MYAEFLPESKEIDITEIEGFRIGQAENAEAATGVTVILSESGFPAGVDVRGGGPASRETELLKPVANASAVHAVVLGGGSAFGLDAAGGVMQCLEEKNIGYDVGVTKVPLVVQSDIFDLTVGSKDVRPDKAMGYRACGNAFIGAKGNFVQGNHGAGTGASVGKLLGMNHAVKTGIGAYALQIGELKVGAVVTVNAVGDVYDPVTGEIIAGAYDRENSVFLNTERLMAISALKDSGMSDNTTIGAVITSASFDKTKLCKIASMAHNGLARTINPVHTTADGDSIYALSVGSLEADINLVGTLAARVVAFAVRNAVLSAESAHGLPSAKSIRKC